MKISWENGFRNNPESWFLMTMIELPALMLRWQNTRNNFVICRSMIWRILNLQLFDNIKSLKEGFDIVASCVCSSKSKQH